MALLANGSVTAWGDTLNGQCNIPATYSNAVAISAGAYNTLLLAQGTVPVPRLFAPAWNGKNFSALLQTLSRNHYVLTFKNSVDDSNWTALPTQPGNGAVLLLSDPATNAPHRFYRSQQF